MNAQRSPTSDPRLQRALDELRGLIQRRYPEATFQVSPAEDDAEIVHLDATVDVEDTEEVVDLVIDRMMQMQIDDGLPIFVIPVRTPERVMQMQQATVAREVPRSSSAPVEP